MTALHKEVTFEGEIVGHMVTVGGWLEGDPKSTIANWRSTPKTSSVGSKIHSRWSMRRSRVAKTV